MKLAELAYIESKKISTFSVSLASSAFPCDTIGLESSAKGFMITIYCTEILAGFSFFSGGGGEGKGGICTWNSKPINQTQGLCTDIS